LLNSFSDIRPIQIYINEQEYQSKSLLIKLNKILCQENINSENLAYILYTSGSTGKPKGVTFTHRNALSFLNWCSKTFQPNYNLIFSSHALFHFELSIIDIFLSLKHGAKLILIDEKTSKNPFLLTQIIATEKITNWYSTPTVLKLLLQYGNLEKYDYSHLNRTAPCQARLYLDIFNNQCF
jgi:acyl-coenzyme A synthetase/AMP-(fatty) acid ligase